MYPKAYTRNFSFQGFQSGSPTAPLPGNRVDEQYDAVHESVDQVIDFLKGIMKSDGTLQNGIVTPDTLSEALSVDAETIEAVSAQVAEALGYVEAASEKADEAAASALAASGFATAASGSASAAAASALAAQTAILQSAGDVPFSPVGGISATDVQAALQEVDAGKAALSHTHPQSEVTGLVTALEGLQSDIDALESFIDEHGGFVVDPHALAIFDELTVPLTIDEQFVVQFAIQRMKAWVSSDGRTLWAKLGLFGTAWFSSELGLLNWKDPGGTAFVNTGFDHAPGQGWIGDGGGDSIDLGVAPSGLTELGQDDAHIGAYLESNASNNNPPLLSDDTTNRLMLNPRNGSDNFVAAVNRASGSTIVVATPDTSSIGHFVATRVDDSNITGYKNGAAVDTVAEASNGVSTANLLLQGYGSHTISFWHAGSNLTADDVAELHAIIRDIRFGVFSGSIGSGGALDDAGLTGAALLETETPVQALNILAANRGLRISEFLTTSDPEEDQNERVVNAFAALMTEARYSGLDFEGLTVGVDGPLDIGAVTGSGTFQVFGSVNNGWLKNLGDPENPPALTVVSRFCNATLNSNILAASNTTGVVPGMEVQGWGIARGCFVLEVETNVSITISQVAHGTSTGTRQLTFTGFPSMLDFINCGNVQHLDFNNFNMHCNYRVGGVRMPKNGRHLDFLNCNFQRVRRFGILDWGEDFNPIELDRVTMVSEYDQFGDPEPIDREGAAVVIQRNDAKCRNSQFIRFKHAAILNGAQTLYEGNHHWAGSGNRHSRSPQVVFGNGRDINSSVIGNYIDNSWIEITNETKPDIAEMGNLEIIGNTFVANQDVTEYPFWWIQVRPVAQNLAAGLHGIKVLGNNFRKLANAGSVDRVERINTAPIQENGPNGSIDTSNIRGVVFRDNNFLGDLDHETHSPATLRRIRTDEQSGLSNLDFDFSDLLPFGLPIQTANATAARLRDGSGVAAYEAPRVLYGTDDGLGAQVARANFPAARRGEVTVVADVNVPASGG